VTAPAVSVGINYRGPLGAQSYGQNFGTTAWYPRGNGISRHRTALERDFRGMKSFGINFVRMGLADDGRALLNAKGKVTGYNRRFKADVKTLLDTARKTGIQVEFAIVDFLIAERGKDVSGVHVQGRDEIFKDKKDREAFIKDFLIPFLKEYGSHPAVKGFDIVNEPEWIKMDRQLVRQFISECIKAIRRHAPGKPVTVGVNTEHAAGFADLDVDYIAIHHYEDRFNDGGATLRRVIDKLNKKGIKWALEEFATSGDPSRVVDYYGLVKEKGGIAIAPWNWCPGIDERTWDSGRERSLFLAPLGKELGMPAHPFAILSGYSLFGLGGGLDWVVLSSALFGKSVYFMITCLPDLTALGVIGVTILGAVSLLFAVTSFIRVKASWDAVSAVYPEFTFWRKLTHDIGNDTVVMRTLKDRAPYTYEQVAYHEAFKYHVPGLLAFVPFIFSLRSIFTKQDRIKAGIRGIRRKMRDKRGMVGPDIRETAPGEKAELAITDIGTYGTHNMGYRDSKTAYRIRQEVERYKSHICVLFEDDEFVVDVKRCGENAALIGKALMDRLRALSGSKRLQRFMEENRDALSDMAIYLLDIGHQKRRKHPHFLTAVGKNFEVAVSGTNQGREQAVYLTRGAFTDIDTRLLVDILINQMKLAVARYEAWHKGEEFPFGDANSPKVRSIINRIRENKTFKKELRELNKFEMEVSRKHAIDPAVCGEIERQLRNIKEKMPYFAPAVTNHKRAVKLREAVEDYDYDSAVKWWGLITCELGELEWREDEEAVRFRNLPETTILSALSQGISGVFNRYIVDNGIYNQEGEEYGKAVGRVRVVDDIDKIDEEFEKADGSEIWVIPYLPFKRPEIPGAGCIVSSGGNRHAVDTAKEQGIPLAVIPNAVELLKGYEGRVGMLRVEKDRDVRFRLAFPDEQGVPREKEEPKVKVPAARIGERRIYRLEEVDENFVTFVGPKAANLGRMINAGINVPEGIALSFAFWERFSSYNELDSRIAEIRQKIETAGGDIRTDGATVKRLLAEIKGLVMDAEFPEDLKRELFAYINKMRKNFGHVGFYVRSSFNFEDLTEKTTSGHYDSYPDGEFTDTSSDEDILRAVKMVFASKWNEIALRARIESNVSDEEVLPAVIVEVPRKALYGGVMYTADPYSYNFGNIDIMASHGQGAAVVGEMGRPAEVIVNKMTGEIKKVQSQSVIDMKYRIINGSLELKRVTVDEREEEILSPALVGRLKEQGKRIEELFGFRPQDIEWCLDENDKLWIVQTRPMRTEKLPAEKMIDDEVLNLLAVIDEGALNELMDAGRVGDIDRLIAWIKLEKGFVELRKDKADFAARVVASRYLSRLADNKRAAAGVTAEQARGIMGFFRKDETNLVDPTTAPELLAFLRKAGAASEDAGVRNAVRDFFEFLGTQSTLHYAHTINLEIAKGLVFYGLFDKALTKLREGRHCAGMPDIADRTIRVLSTIPAPGAVQKLETFRKAGELPEWIGDYALRVIDKLKADIDRIRAEVPEERYYPRVPFFTLDDVEVKGKTVGVRVDINGSVIDGRLQMTRRITEAAVTLKELADKGAKVVTLAHQGRPGDENYLEYMDQHAAFLQREIQTMERDAAQKDNRPEKQYEVLTIEGDDLFGPAAQQAISGLKEGQILLLKNVRSWKGEKKKEGDHSRSELVRNLQPLFDLYVIDGFSVSHRGTPSVTGFTGIPNAAGRLMQKELEGLARATEHVEKPYVMSLGGVKIDDYLGLMEKALEEGWTDSIVTGGGLANVLLMARGYNIGEVNVEFLRGKMDLDEAVNAVKRLDKLYPGKLIVPVDVALEDDDGRRKEIPVPYAATDQPITEYPIFDIGEKTIALYAGIADKAKTVYIKGPLGFFEKDEFIKGTQGVFGRISKKTETGELFSFGGGGDTDRALERTGTRLTYQTLAGGATLQYLEDKDSLPGVQALKASVSKGLSRDLAKRPSAEKAAEGFNVIVGAAEEIYIGLGEGLIETLEKELGVRIIPIKAGDGEAMIKELEKKTEGQKAIAALLDIDADTTPAEIKDIIADLKERATRDIIELTHPEISSLTDENVRRIQDAAKMKNILALLARLLPEGRSYRLSEKSIYDMRMDRIYDLHRKDYTDNLKAYLGSDLDRGGKRRYTVTAVDTAFDLKLLAGSIKERRETMGMKPGEEDPVTDFILVRSDRITEDNIEEVLEATGLGRYLSSDRMILTGGDATLTPEQVLRRIAERTGIEEAQLRGRLAIGQKAGIIDVDTEQPEDIFREVLFVQLEKGLASQLYKMMLEIMANADETPKAVDGQLERVKGFKFYLYLPKVEAIDLETEVRNYERYVLEVLVKA
ncbi:MAG: phosphoglycerate kinase, partial [Candidatus Makaraimicrobium thalassicum]